MGEKQYLTDKAIEEGNVLHDELVLALAERIELLAAKYELEQQEKDVTTRIDLMDRIIGRREMGKMQNV